MRHHHNSDYTAVETYYLSNQKQEDERQKREEKLDRIGETHFVAYEMNNNKTS